MGLPSGKAAPIPNDAQTIIPIGKKQVAHTVLAGECVNAILCELIENLMTPCSVQMGLCQK